MIKLADIFKDNIIIQRNMPFMIWGETDTDQTVSVTINGDICLNDEIKKGKFSLTLPAHEAAENTIIEISGSAGDSAVLKNADFGEIWIAGGQSNIEFPLKYDEEGEKTIKNACDNHLRFFYVPQYSFEGEEKDGFRDESRWNAWFPFRPEYIETFSAPGLYFAKELRKSLGVPVGIIGCYWGGTTASAWTREYTLRNDPVLKIYTDEYDEAVKNLDIEEYKKQDRKARRPRNYLDDKVNDFILYGKHEKFVEFYIMHHKFFPRVMGPQFMNRPAALYENMLMKICPYTCRGVIWYQGESDEYHAEIYGRLFTAMINDWRTAWDCELPFLFVQLAPYGGWLGNKASKYHILREEQEKVSHSVPGTYMASIMDAGMENDIHPKKKKPVGERLALLARGKIYGEDILCDPPAYSGYIFSGGKLEISLKNCGDGLILRGDKVNSLRLFSGDSEITGFCVSVSGDTLTVTGENITAEKITEIRFAYEQYCEVNLFSSADLPAKPFRVFTDGK